MATIHECDHCGDRVKPADAVNVVIAKPAQISSMFEMLYGQARSRAKEPYELAMLLCTECATHIALALKQTQARVRRGQHADS